METRRESADFGGREVFQSGRVPPFYTQLLIITKIQKSFSTSRYYSPRLAPCKKKGYIKENPIEEVEKPEKNQFISKFYNSEELSEVIRLSRGTKLELPVIFGGFYGLR